MILFYLTIDVDAMSLNEENGVPNNLEIGIGDNKDEKNETQVATVIGRRKLTGYHQYLRNIAVSIYCNTVALQF